MRFAGEKVRLDAEALEPGMSARPGPPRSLSAPLLYSLCSAHSLVQSLDSICLRVETVPKEVTVAVLKPDLVASGRVDEVIAKV